MFTAAGYGTPLLGLLNTVHISYSHWAPFNVVFLSTYSSPSGLLRVCHKCAVCHMLATWRTMIVIEEERELSCFSLHLPGYCDVSSKSCSNLTRCERKVIFWSLTTFNKCVKFKCFAETVHDLWWPKCEEILNLLSFRRVVSVCGQENALCKISVLTPLSARSLHSGVLTYFGWM